MNLAERSSRQVLWIEKGERFGYSDAQFPGHDLLHFGIRERFYFILERGQRLQIRGWQKISPAGKQLAQFDEGGPILSKSSANSSGRGEPVR